MELTVLTMRVTVSWILDLSSKYVCTSYAVAMFAYSRPVEKRLIAAKRLAELE